MSSTSALQKAVYETLLADAALTALIGSGRLFDDVPPATRPPYLLFAGSGHSDWSTGTEAGEAHAFGIEVWSAGKGRKEAAAIAAAVRDALAGLAAIEPPWHLVSLRHESTTFERDPQTEYFRGLMRFRALVETN
ncbi:MAG: hypothetical protein BroJett030_32300 [Alphaproteobacteria bacterium]|nr:MAG: hypothetical protein BroJett030_32300 [Alphaproteobacteria bacterium]